MEKSVSKKLKTALFVAAGAAVLVAVYFAVVYFAVFKPTFGRSDYVRSQEEELKFYVTEENYQTHLTDEEWFKSLNCPLIEITSFDNLKLKALVFESEGPCRGTVLLMHGYTSGPVREFATISKFLHSMNYRVVLPYQRAHGLSEGKWMTFGINERYDCRDWVTKINQLYSDRQPLFIGGISMGCATVTMAAGFDFPENVKGFISDCGFTTPWEICYWSMTHNMGLSSGIADLMLKTNSLFAKAAGFSLDGWSTLQALSQCRKPVLFITGTDDHTVPWEMSMANFMHYKTVNPENTKLVLFEGGAHAISYLVDAKLYQDELRSFIEKYE